MERKIPSDFRVTYHGIDHNQYFNGHGVSFSKFTDCATGIGYSEAEALDDALEQLSCEWDTGPIDSQLKEEVANLETMREAQEKEIGELLHDGCDPDSECDHDCDLYFWVSVDVVADEGLTTVDA